MDLPVQRRDELNGLAYVLSARTSGDLTWIHCPNLDEDAPMRLLAPLDDGIRAMYLCGSCESTHTLIMVESVPSPLESA
jgi:hypothetical protein